MNEHCVEKSLFVTFANMLLKFGDISIKSPYLEYFKVKQAFLISFVSRFLLLVSILFNTENNADETTVRKL